MDCELSGFMSSACQLYKVYKASPSVVSRKHYNSGTDVSLSVAAAALFLVKEQIGEVSNTNISHRETSPRAVSIKIWVHKREPEKSCSSGVHFRRKIRE